MSTRAALLAAGLLVSLSCAPPAGAAEPPSVVVSIKPLYGLVARVMEGVGEPVLLVTGAGSLHTYSLKPSQALSLESADLVVWVGPSLETFLKDPLAALARDAAVVEAEDLPGIVLLAPREGGTWEAHAHDHDDHDHDDHDHDEAHEHDHGHDHDHDHHGAVDGHLFLDPGNAQVIAGAVAEALAVRDPQNAAVYRANATALQQDLTALDQEIEASLADLGGRPYVVFHDAYQYFEVHFGIPAAGSITVSPDQAPGARRLVEVREKILGLGAVCVFTEPDFQPALVETLVQGTKARIGILDPEAAALEPSPETYDRLLRDLAANLRECLSAG